MGRYGCNDIIQLVIINQTMRLFIFRQYPEYSYLNGATISPWNRLYLPSNGPRFESRGCHRCFFDFKLSKFKLCLILHCEKDSINLIILYLSR